MHQRTTSLSLPVPCRSQHQNPEIVGALKSALLLSGPMPRVSRTVSSAAESADKLAAPAEAGRPHKAARVAPSKLPDSTSTLCGATSYGSIPDDAQLAPFESHITGCSVSFSRAHSSAGSTASSTACASPAQSASDTGSRCWSAPSSPFVRLDGPALTDKAGLRPIARTCDEPRRESRGADRETACATSGEGGGAGASASDGGGSAVLSVDSILRLPLALAEQQVYTFFETSLGVDDPKDLERTMKASARADAAWTHPPPSRQRVLSPCPVPSFFDSGWPAAGENPLPPLPFPFQGFHLLVGLRNPFFSSERDVFAPS